jgi:hemin uptake protein HemP
MKQSSLKNQQAPISDKIKIDARDLFKTHKEIIITHRGEDYCLRITSNDKLILTK